ncbi:NAD(P)/FAD-dependent oxidoreductase [Desulforhopalus singaporensis]|uniref:Pyridine nucleotide-disulfide oxidoreductase family protein n=1 Tax=Desulforhopalus singaporensis TaxID=91360 RepID=A0A1H0SSH0_9BACT|nr:FAD-dependent oxidoreductase [Desulforhopalus singaporensis]SDP44176.1 pyridine nucleotide-disulfide oxidoreductase family protein [Desulforhopalus singaporensis]
MATKQLVLIGGGHAHMVTLARLRSFVKKGYGVTVIQPSDHHYYSGMGPGMLGGTYLPDQIRFNTRKVVKGQGGRFVRDKARLVDPVRRVVLLEQSETEISYNVLSCNAGSFVPRAGIVTDQTVFTAKPIEGLWHAREEIIRRAGSENLEIAIVGGGPSSVEIAGNIWQLTRNCKCSSITIRIFAGSKLMGHLPAQIGRLARRIFNRRGIELIEGSYVKEMGGGDILLENGTTYRADLLFPAMGVRPSKIFAESGLSTGTDGGLLVNKYLQSIGDPNIFGGGDCICFQPQPLDKVGVYAVRENPVLYHNLMAALDGDELKPFNPGGKYLLIYNLGGGVGIFCKWSIVFAGKLAFRIKDHIDRKFIDTFQAIEREFQ